MSKRKRTVKGKSKRTKKNNSKQTSSEKGKNILFAIIVILLLMFGLGAITRIFGDSPKDPSTESSGIGKVIRVTEIILDEESLIF